MRLLLIISMLLLTNFAFALMPNDDTEFTTCLKEDASSTVLSSEIQSRRDNVLQFINANKTGITNISIELLYKSKDRNMSAVFFHDPLSESKRELIESVIGAEFLKIQNIYYSIKWLQGNQTCEAKIKIYIDNQYLKNQCNVSEGSCSFLCAQSTCAPK